MDKIGADFEFSYGTLRERLGANAIAVQLPIGAGDTFEGIVDLIEMKAYYFDQRRHGMQLLNNAKYLENMQEMAEIWRHDIIERIAELDDELTELYLEDESAITESQLKAALRRATIDLESVPNLLWICSQRHRCSTST